MKPQVHLKCVVGPPTKPNYLVCEVRSKSDTLLKTYARKLPTTFDTLSPDNRDRFINKATKTILEDAAKQYNVTPGYLWPL
jgi:hypothetical protein